MFIYGSVCSGIEAATVAWNPLGWNPLGWKPGWFAEIEGFPSEVLEQHYPEVVNQGDMTAIGEMIEYGAVDAPDVLVGGTPCQAFSVAGMREGLADPRGELTIRYVELADAIDRNRERQNKPPSIIVWENVPGVLSSKDNAFGCFLGALAGEDSELQPTGKKWPNSGCVYGPKRAIAWRVLDAQYFGLAQRRNRVFLVASARDGFDPAKILFEFDSVRRDSAPSREKREEVAADASTSSGAANPVVGALCARDFKGVGKQYVAEGKPIIENPYQQVSQHGTGIVATPYRMVAFGEYADDNSASTMKARDYKDATDLVCVHGSQHGRRSEGCLTGWDSQGNRVQTGLMSTLTSNMSGGAKLDPVLVHLSDEEDLIGSVETEEVMPINTMTMLGRPSDDIKPRMGSGIGRPCDPQNTLTKAHMHGVFVAAKMCVRRLTPIECERLQGFPDNYTQIPWRGRPAEECPDGHRYKALGNSMAVPCMRWVGQRIANYLGRTADMELDDLI